jgi:murein L,D-transpeptidase YcbB/YkuD
MPAATGSSHRFTIPGWLAAGAMALAVLLTLPAAASAQDAAVTTGTVRAEVEQLLRSALDRYRGIAAAGGWEPIEAGPTIEPGSEDPRLSVLARRLAATGDLPPGPAEFDTYGHDLQAAVRRFQSRHGLEPDARVGPATLRALNVPVDQRIAQLRVNVERVRRTAGLSGDFVLVNVPAFRAVLYRDGVPAWTTRVIAGVVRWPTPEFRADMQHVVLNPPWEVPRSIAVRELLPKIQADPHFLARGRYDLYDRAGQPVDPAGIDWTQLSSRHFPYSLVQRPGPMNELGQVKFMLPNEYGVSMHDTPRKDLFAKASRAFSHGCIRVERPLDLAARLLEGEGWSRDRIDAQVASARTTTISLPAPLPVVVVYWTAAVDESGTVNFYPDIYAKDAALLMLLDN